MRLWIVTLGLVALLSLEGCSDNPALPAPASVPAFDQRDGLKGSEARTFRCFTSIAISSGKKGYRYSALSIRLPAGAMSPDSGTVVYRLIVQPKGQPVAAMANCRIPRTALAVRLTSKRFGVQARHPVSGPGGARGGEDSEFRTTSGECNPAYPVQTGCTILIGEITVVAEPGGTTLPTDIDLCDTWGECGSYPTYPPPSGGGPGPDPGTPDPTQPDCEQSSILGSPEVQNALKDLWNKSNPGANESSRRESGGWIVRNPDGSYGVQEFTYTQRGPCTVGFLLSDRPANAEGWIHIHPYRLNETQEHCPRTDAGLPIYDGRLNAGDRNVIRALERIQSGLGHGFAADANGITEFSSRTREGGRDDRYDRCGY